MTASTRTRECEPPAAAADREDHFAFSSRPAPEVPSRGRAEDAAVPGRRRCSADARRDAARIFLTPSSLRDPGHERGPQSAPRGSGGRSLQPPRGARARSSASSSRGSTLPPCPWGPLVVFRLTLDPRVRGSRPAFGSSPPTLLPFARKTVFRPRPPGPPIGGRRAPPPVATDRRRTRPPTERRNRHRDPPFSWTGRSRDSHLARHHAGGRRSVVSPSLPSYPDVRRPPFSVAVYPGRTPVRCRYTGRRPIRSRCAASRHMYLLSVYQDGLRPDRHVQARHRLDMPMCSSINRVIGAAVIPPGPERRAISGPEQSASRS